MMANRSDELVKALTGVLEPLLGMDMAVAGLDRLAGGSSCETWGFEARPRRGVARKLVLRLAAPDGALLGIDLEREARILTAARHAGVPVPEVVASGVLPEQDLDGAVPDRDSGAAETRSGDAAEIRAGGAADDTRPFLVLEHIEGETIARRILRDARFDTARAVLVSQCARALASVHEIQLGECGSLPRGDQLALLASIYESSGQPHPAFDLAIRWLRERTPPAVEERLVHGDFRLGNFIVGKDGLRAVLDWEMVHAGDPVEDLGWMCVRAWRFGSDLPVAGIGTYDELISEYTNASGREVDIERLRWWEAVGTLRWGVVCILQAARHGSGRQRSVELAAIGRRVCEVEWDLLNLMGVPVVPLPNPDETGDEEPGPSGAPERLGLHSGWQPHDVPPITDLLDSASEFLLSEAVPVLSGRTAFFARVAANVAAMASREIRLGPGLQAAHRHRLEKLGYANDAELAAAIASGALDHRNDELAAAVRASVAAKLAVANPAYAAGASVE